MDKHSNTVIPLIIEIGIRLEIRALVKPVEVIAIGIEIQEQQLGGSGLEGEREVYVDRDRVAAR